MKWTVFHTSKEPHYFIPIICTLLHAAPEAKQNRNKPFFGVGGNCLCPYRNQRTFPLEVLF